MNLPYETLTPILGDKATYDPTTETTPDFMNGKFGELLQNDKLLKDQINVLNYDRGYLNTTHLPDETYISTIKKNGKYKIWNAPDRPSGFGNLSLIEIINQTNDSFCTQKLSDNLGNQAIRVADGNNSLLSDWIVLSTESKAVIDIPYNSGYESMGYDYKNTIEKFGNKCKIFIGVKKSDGTSFEANTVYQLFTLPSGFFNGSYNIGTACTGEGNSITSGQLFVEGNCVYIKMASACTYVKGILPYNVTN